MTDEQARQLIALLKHAQRRPGMFFPVDRSGVRGFLAGIYTAQLAFFGPAQSSTITDDILRERGWQLPNSMAPWAEMEARQYTIDQIIQEVLTIEIESLRRSYNLRDDQ